MGRFMFTEFVVETVYIVLCLSDDCLCMDVDVAAECVEAEPSGAMRCGVREGEGVAEWTCKIDSWTRSERVPEVAGINRRAGASFDLSHARPPRTPPPTTGHFIASAACLHGYGKTRSMGSRPPITRNSTL